MIAFLKKLFPSPEDTQAKHHYVALVEQARQPFLYQDCGLPDTLDGRYEAIVLHLFIAECLLPENAESMKHIRNLHEAFFEDMDRSLREGGVGDTGIGKRVKRMAAGLYGRLQAYRDSTHEPSLFKEALLRNAYATCTTAPSDHALQQLMTYITQQITVR